MFGQVGRGLKLVFDHVLSGGKHKTWTPVLCGSGPVTGSIGPPVFPTPKNTEVNNNKSR